MNLDPETLRQMRLHLEALLALIRDVEGRKNSGDFKKDGLSSEELRLLVRASHKNKETA